LNKLKINSNNILNILFLIYAFSIPFDKEITKIIGLLLLLLWIIEGDFINKFKLIFTSKVIVAFILFIIYNYLSILCSNHYEYALNYVNKYLYYIPILIIFTSIKKEYIKYSITSFIIAMFISEIVTYGIFFDYWTTSYNTLHSSSSPTAFMSHTIYSALISFTAILTLYKIIYEKNIYLKIIFILFYTSISLNLFISGGRTGLVPYIIVQVLLLIYIYKHKVKYIIISLSIISFLFYFSYKNINIFNKRINQAYSNIINIKNKNFNSSWGTRVAMIYVGLKIIQDNPIFGVGIKDNMDKMIEYINNINEYDFNHLKRYYKWHFHNQYIDILTQIGIVGLVLFFLIFYYLISIDIKDNYINTIKIIVTLTILFSIISSDLFHQKHYMYLISLFIGLIIAQNMYEKEEYFKNV